MNNWRQVLAFDDQDFYKKFPNLRRREGDEEICRTVLNNGFFTIAYNISSTEKDNWIRFFTSIGASKQFIYSLESIFDNKAAYEDPERHFYDDEDPEQSAWEDMEIDADNLDKLAQKEGLTKKMMKIAHW